MNQTFSDTQPQGPGTRYRHARVTTASEDRVIICCNPSEFGPKVLSYMGQRTDASVWLVPEIHIPAHLTPEKSQRIYPRFQSYWTPTSCSVDGPAALPRKGKGGTMACCEHRLRSTHLADFTSECGSQLQLPFLDFTPMVLELAGWKLLVVTLYLTPGVGLHRPPNSAKLSMLAAWLQLFRLPWIVVEDWNNTPADVAASSWFTYVVGGDLARRGGSIHLHTWAAAQARLCSGVPGLQDVRQGFAHAHCCALGVSRCFAVHGFHSSPSPMCDGPGQATCFVFAQAQQQARGPAVPREGGLGVVLCCCRRAAEAFLRPCDAASRGGPFRVHPRPTRSRPPRARVPRVSVGQRALLGHAVWQAHWQCAPAMCSARSCAKVHAGRPRRRAAPQASCLRAGVTGAAVVVLALYLARLDGLGAWVGPWAFAERALGGGPEDAWFRRPGLVPRPLGARRVVGAPRWRPWCVCCRPCAVGAARCKGVQEGSLPRAAARLHSPP